MNKSPELNTIDYALIKNIEKGGMSATLENTIYALKCYVYENNPMAITSRGDARKYICNLNKDDIYKELLKNIIKNQAFSTERGYARLLGTNKKFSDNLTMEELELLVTKALDQSSMEMIEHYLYAYPQIVDKMINSFVSTRYYSNDRGINNLDNVNIQYYLDLLQKVDNYYDMKKINEAGYSPGAYN